MVFEYGYIDRTVKYMVENYSFKDYGKYHSLIELLNVMGEDGWELIASVDGSIFVKRRVD